MGPVMNLADYGVVGGILTTVFAGLGITARVLYRRLLGENGLLTRVFERHLEYVDRNQAQTDDLVASTLRQEAHLEQQGQRLHELTGLHHDPASIFSTIATEEALEKMARAQQALLRDDQDRAIEILKDIERGLAARAAHRRAG